MASVAFSAPTTLPCGALVLAVACLRRVLGLCRASGEDEEEAVEEVDEVVEEVDEDEAMEDKGEISRRRLEPRPAAAASIMDMVEMDVGSDVDRWTAVLVAGLMGIISTQRATARSCVYKQKGGRG